MVSAASWRAVETLAADEGGVVIAGVLHHDAGLDAGVGAGPGVDAGPS